MEEAKYIEIIVLINKVHCKQAKNKSKSQVNGRNLKALNAVTFCKTDGHGSKAIK